jgi:cytochrome c
MKMKHLMNIILLSALVGVCLGFKPAKNPDQSISGNIEKGDYRSKPFNFYLQEKDTSKWEAPASANNLVNPIPVNEETLAEGALVYKKTCRSCHGRNGDGKGVEAADLSTAVTDFTNPEVFEQSDGSLYWKTAEGRNDMLPLKDDLSEEEIWMVISFIKTFAQPSEE